MLNFGLFLFERNHPSLHFIVENGELFVVGGRMFKKRNDIEHCTTLLFPLVYSVCSFSALHHRKLFYANEIFQGVLIHVKAMCEVYYFGQTNRVKPFYLLDRYAYQQTLTLEEFTRRQFTQMDETLVKLMQFIDQVAVLAADACQVKVLFRNRRCLIGIR